MTVHRIGGSVPPQEIYKLKVCPERPGDTKCLGPECALYVQQLNDKGHVLGGNCAITTSAIAQMQLLHVLGAIAGMLQPQQPTGAPSNV